MLQPVVVGVRPMPDYHLLIDYENGERRMFDVKPYITGEWFGALRDEAVFRTVRPCGTTVEWSDGQDIAPHELYELSVAVDSIDCAG